MCDSLAEELPQVPSANKMKSLIFNYVRGVTDMKISQFLISVKYNIPLQDVEFMNLIVSVVLLT